MPAATPSAAPEAAAWLSQPLLWSWWRRELAGWRRVRASARPSRASAERDACAREASRSTAGMPGDPALRALALVLLPLELAVEGGASARLPPT
jgi:hypothetical protein